MSTFEILDANQDGRISKKELRDAAFLIGLNPTKRELEAWWREADTNSECADVWIVNQRSPYRYEGCGGAISMVNSSKQKLVAEQGKKHPLRNTFWYIETQWSATDIVHGILSYASEVRGFHKA